MSFEDRGTVLNTPPIAYYYPNFITEYDQEEIIRKVYSAPKPKWTVLANRRLQDYGGVHTARGWMLPQEMPAWLVKYTQKVDGFLVEKPALSVHLKDSKSTYRWSNANHVLINEYQPGQGILAHTDGPIYYPLITTISCGSHTVLNFCENTEKRAIVCRLLLEPRSLVVITSDLYTKYLHFIEQHLEDVVNSETICNWSQLGGTFTENSILMRTTRVSLTIRSVLNVVKLKAI